MAGRAGSAASGRDRPEDDAYWTPPVLADALIAVIRRWYPWLGDAWECAAGAGHLAERLRAAGLLRAATTLIDYGYGCPHGVDMLTAPIPDGCSTIITNPPYGRRAVLANALIERIVREMDAGRLAGAALLLPSSYLHGRWRSELLDRAMHGVWLCRGRHSMYPPDYPIPADQRATTTIDFAWFVFGGLMVKTPGVARVGWLSC